MNNGQLTEKIQMFVKKFDCDEHGYYLNNSKGSSGDRLELETILEMFCSEVLPERVALATQEAYEECSNAVLTLMPQKNVTGLTEQEYEKAEVIADVLCELEKLTSGGGKAE